MDNRSKGSEGESQADRKDLPKNENNYYILKTHMGNPGGALKLRAVVRYWVYTVDSLKP